jgi:hypothetical protein
VRTAIAALLLAIATPAYALPVDYTFTSPIGPGSFSYDAATGLGTLDCTAPSEVTPSFLVHVAVPATVIDGSGYDSLAIHGTFPTWPAAPELFPLVSGYVELQISGPELFDAAGALRGDLTYPELVNSTQLLVYQSWVEFYQASCPTLESAPQDCPRSAFVYTSDHLTDPHLFAIHPVPEPELGVLAAAAMLLAAATRRLGGRRST